jgi:hypothetical protein
MGATALPQEACLPDVDGRVGEISEFFRLHDGALRDRSKPQTVIKLLDEEKDSLRPQRNAPPDPASRIPGKASSGAV